MSPISATQNQINPLTGLVGATSATATKSTSGTTAGSSSTSTKSSAGGLATESNFLSLLVAQLKNQDPEQPADGTTFVTQLAQFTTLEQNLAMRTDLDSINTDLSTSTSAVSAPAGTSGSSTTGSNPFTGA